MALLSKFTTVDTTCREYAHPWSDSCFDASLGLLSPCLKESLRIYVVAYSVALLMRGKVPSSSDIKRTFFSILQSCIFLTSHGVGYSAVLCLLRRIIGNYNFLTVSFLPSFLSSLLAILIERPSRRGLLSLYVTNVASETLFKMVVSRNLVKPIRYGEVLVFSTSVAYLLYFYKGEGLPKDPIYSLLRFLVGPYDEFGHIKDSNNFSYPPSKYFIADDVGFLSIICKQINYKYKKLMHKIKSFSSHPSCPHPFSCVYYVLQGASKSLATGVLLQVVLKIIMNFKKIIIRPNEFKKIILKPEVLKLGAAFASFTALFRGISCLMRKFRECDSKFNAIPAGLVAGLSFFFYRDNTIALYFMWKTFQISYNLGVENGCLIEVPYASVFLHALSTAILFHVAIVEPQNLRNSYWKFLQAMSGGRISQMDRKCIDTFGLNTSKYLEIVLKEKP